MTSYLLTPTAVADLARPNSAFVTLARNLPTAVGKDAQSTISAPATKSWP